MKKPKWKDNELRAYLNFLPRFCPNCGSRLKHIVGDTELNPYAYKYYQNFSEIEHKCGHTFDNTFIFTKLREIDESHIGTGRLLERTKEDQSM